jgi:ABC-type transport system involved in cytochrome bd biosynthesis fused ATPase/permease subunit
MGGFILLLLIVIVVVFVVPAVALAKASQALRAIEQLRERLRMLETRPQAPR